MIHANELKPGVIYIVNGAPHMVGSVFKQTPSARGGTTLYKVRAHNVLTKSKVDQTYKGDDSFEQPNFAKRPLQYLYADGDSCVFMDTETYEQYNIPFDELEEQSPYLLEDMEGIDGLLLEERLVGIELPDAVEMNITACDPSVRGATAAARSKPATTETGLVVQVPEYMSSGERIRVDTREGRFLGRA